MDNRGLHDYVQLRNFIENGDVEKVQKLMKSAQTIANYELSFDTPLHWAIRFNDLMVIKTLIDAPDGLRVKNHHRQSPLELAVILNQINVVSMILKGRVCSEKLYRSMVKQATYNGNAEMVNLLINHGVKNNISLNLKNSLNIAVGIECVAIVRSILPYCKFEPNENLITICTSKTSQNFRECIRLLFEHGYIINPHYYDFVFVTIAINNKHTIVIRELLKAGMNSNYSDRKTGYSLLHVACFTEQFDIVKMLVDNNADINAKYVECPEGKEATPEEKMDFGLTPLDVAVNNLDVQTTRLLLERGAILAESQAFSNIVAMERYCKYKRKAIIEILVEYIVDGNAPVHIGDNFLQYFTKFGQDFEMCDYITVNNIVTLLVEKGADVNAIDSYGHSLLHITIYKSFFEMFQALLEHGANIDLITLRDETLLHAAAYQDDPRFIDVILNYNIPINNVCNRNWTSLHYAAYHGSVNVVNSLLQHNAEVNIKDRDGNTPLFLAVMNEHQDIVQNLLHYNAEANTYNNYFYTPLLLATISANFEIIKILLDFKADVNARDIIQCQPLHYASAATVHNSLDIVQLLLDNNADINAVDTNGSTPLHYATSGCNEEIVKILLKNNADSNIQNVNGQTPFFYAIQYPNIALIRIMLENNVDTTVRDKDGRTPIFYMSLAEHELVPEIIKLLLKFNIYIDCYDQDNFEKSLLYNAQHVAKNNATVESFMELEKLKTEKIEGTNITFDYLLRESSTSLSRFVNNANVRKALKTAIREKKFPLTMKIIRDRFIQATTNSYIAKPIREKTYSNIFDELPSNCVDKILSYISTEEAEVLLNVSDRPKWLRLSQMTNCNIRL